MHMNIGNETARASAPITAATVPSPHSSEGKMAARLKAVPSRQELRTVGDIAQSVRCVVNSIARAAFRMRTLRDLAIIHQIKSTQFGSDCYHSDPGTYREEERRAAARLCYHLADLGDPAASEPFVLWRRAQSLNVADEDQSREVADTIVQFGRLCNLAAESMAALRPGQLAPEDAMIDAIIVHGVTVAALLEVAAGDCVEPEGWSDFEKGGWFPLPEETARPIRPKTAPPPETFAVMLTGAGDKKIQVIKLVRAITGLDLKETKDLVDGLPKPVREAVAKAQAEEIKRRIEEAGGTAEIK
jgi:large subunit ribosomal protein L7/L12